jgi:hypothetical protein
MDMMKQLEEYVNGNALNDFKAITPSLNQLIGELSLTNGPFKQLQIESQMTKMMGGMNAANTRRNMNKTNAKTNTNTNAKKNTNITAKNRNQGISDEKKFRISLLLAFMLLGALAHLRGITPFIYSFTQFAALNKKEMFYKAILPFMSMIEGSFTFLKTTLLPNIKEGLYTKAFATFSGMDFASDPNKVMATVTNIGKVQVFMVSFVAGALNLVYTPSVPVMDKTKLGPILDEILKALNEKFKGIKNFVFMAIDPGSYLLKPEWTPDKA